MVNLLRPSAGNITNGYRAESAGPNKPVHLAVDFGWGNGKSVVAAQPGVLTFDTSNGYGLRATIAHPDGSFTRYSHLASGSPERNVSIGEVIGVMGQSGTLPKGVHLHFEYIVRGVKRDPTPYFVNSPPSTPPETPERSVDHMMLIIKATDTQELVVATPSGIEGCTAFLASAINRAEGRAEGHFVLLARSEINAIDSTLRTAAARNFSNNSSALTPAQNAALMGLPAAIDNMPTNGELSGVITSQYNLLRTGATNDKNEILAAIDEIPGGSAPQNLTVTLTGTAEAAQ